MQTKQRSGINIEKGDSCSKAAFSWAAKTFSQRNKKLGSIATSMKASFAQIIHYPPHLLAIASDGIGTKIELAERVGIYNTLGYDLLTMVADDLLSVGAEPTNLSNILDVDHLDQSIVDELMQGLSQAASENGIAITGGEIAELGNRVSGWGKKMHFNWCATAIGTLSQGFVLNGSDIQEGDAVISLKSRGFRSNGFSLIRSILKKKFGENWHKRNYDSKNTWGEILLTPSLSYTPVIMSLIAKGIYPKAIAHITGGGIAGNLKRVITKPGLGAHLNSLFSPHPFMEELLEMGKISMEKAYELWNMGQGMILVTAQENAKKTLSQLNQGIYEAKQSGSIINQPRIAIEAKGIKTPLITRL